MDYCRDSHRVGLGTKARYIAAKRPSPNTQRQIHALPPAAGSVTGLGPGEHKIHNLPVRQIPPSVMSSSSAGHYADAAAGWSAGSFSISILGIAAAVPPRSVALALGFLE